MEMNSECRVEKEELKSWEYLEETLLDILNKEYDLETAIEDIKSFRNTKYYTGHNKKFVEAI